MLNTFILSTSHPVLDKFLGGVTGYMENPSLQLQGEMSLKWLENKPHQRWMNISSPNFHLLCPSAIPYWHVGKGTSMLRQLFLCCPVFAIRTGPRETFSSWFCTAYPVSVEFIGRKGAHGGLPGLSRLKKIFHYSPVTFMLKYFNQSQENLQH